MHIPKGSMCCSCARSGHDCSSLPFAIMPPLKRYDDGTVAVRCTSFSKSK